MVGRNMGYLLDMVKLLRKYNPLPEDAEKRDVEIVDPELMKDVERLIGD